MFVLLACCAAAPARQKQVVVSVRVDQVLGEGRRRPLQPAARLESGSDLSLQAEVTSDAYVYVMQASASGQATQIFPAPGAKEARVPAGQAVLLPPAGQSFRLEGSGREEFYVVVATRPLAQADPEIHRALVQRQEYRPGPGRRLVPSRGPNDPPPPPPPPPPGPVDVPKRGIVLASDGTTLRVQANRAGVAVVRFWVELTPPQKKP